MEYKKILWIVALALVLIFAGCVPQGEEAPADEGAPVEEPTEQKEETAESGGEEASIKAIYIGRMDPGFVEILENGEYSSYMFQQVGQAASETGEIESYSAVDIRFIENEEGRRQIESMTRADAPGVGNAPEIEFEGEIADMFGVGVCMVEGEPYHLALELLLSSSKFVEEGDYIDFDYYVDDYGRKVITSYEKIFIESGRFEGISGSSINVKLSGNPDEIEAKSFMMSAEAEEKIKNMQLKTGEQILFRYTIGQGGLKKVVSLERMSQ